MDLLGGYGSDDTSSSGSGDEAPPAASASQPASSAKQQQRQRRGKKLVSLHAVLPTHILDQLTKGVAMDSDEEEEPKVAAAVPEHDTKHHAKDEGLSSLLSELKSAPTTNLLAAGGNSKPVSSSEPLGQAFMATTTTFESKQDQDVVDIHAAAKPVMKNPPAAARPVPVAASVPRPTMSVPRPSTTSRLQVPAPPAPASTIHAPPPQQDDYAQAIHAPQAPDARVSKKRSRKEMEKALREGKLDVCETTVEAHGAIYEPQQDTYAVPTHGITKVAPVRMYDPKAGSDVVSGITGKHRGKHQINQLLASAASLELQRARAPGNTAKAKRADAKRKYGW